MGNYSVIEGNRFTIEYYNWPSTLSTAAAAIAQCRDMRQHLMPPDTVNIIETWRSYLFSLEYNYFLLFSFFSFFVYPTIE